MGLDYEKAFLPDWLMIPAARCAKVQLVDENSELPLYKIIFFLLSILLVWGASSSSKRSAEVVTS